MPAQILIVGQGIAGSLLAWEFERAGFSFEVADPGEGKSASLLAAGMINPITGMRFVKTPGFERLMASARATYRDMEATLGISAWTDMRVHRLFRNGDEKRAFEGKRLRGEFGEFVRESDASGFWIEGAARVDTVRLLGAVRTRLKSQGKLREERVDSLHEAARYDLVVDCSGPQVAKQQAYAGTPWRLSKGELLRLEVIGLEQTTILNRGNWVLPTGAGKASVGATHEPQFANDNPTEAARLLLEREAADLIRGPFEVVGHGAGVRIGLPDRLPALGRNEATPRLGVLTGLGNKGVLTAPSLARQWMNHVSEGVAFESNVSLQRFNA